MADTHRNPLNTDFTDFTDKTIARRVRRRDGVGGRSQQARVPLVRPHARGNCPGGSVEVKDGDECRGPAEHVIDKRMAAWFGRMDIDPWSFVIGGTGQARTSTVKLASNMASGYQKDATHCFVLCYGHFFFAPLSEKRAPVKMASNMFVRPKSGGSWRSFVAIPGRTA